jgi:hypothetical protein
MQEHFCLDEGVSKAGANIMFNNAACKVMKHAFFICPMQIYHHVLHACVKAANEQQNCA